MTNLIAFDIGDKRIGIAVSDPFGEMALPLETLWRKNTSADVAYLVDLAKKRGAEKIVCGLPLNFDGSECEQTAKTAAFIEKLKSATDIPIETVDERFTTAEARRLLLQADMRREKRKDVIDKIAASYILENYICRMKNKRSDENV